MKIEFSYCGNGTNIEVSLIEDLGGTEHTFDKFWTATHRFPFCMVPGSSACDYAQTFYDMEAVMAPPIIGGHYGHLHPYWAERAEKRKVRNES
jgi:hypothetical protein